MSKFFFPTYPNRDYIHGYFKRAVATDILTAFQFWTSNHEIDIKWKASNNTWFITLEDIAISIGHKTRLDAMIWILENWNKENTV